MTIIKNWVTLKHNIERQWNNNDTNWGENWCKKMVWWTRNEWRILIKFHCCVAEKLLTQPGHVELSSVCMTPLQPSFYNLQIGKLPRLCKTHREKKKSISSIAHSNELGIATPSLLLRRRARSSQWEKEDYDPLVFVIMD